MSAVAGGAWESKFSDWTGRASDAEQKRYENTRDAIREALQASSSLQRYSFEVYAKGSYPNFTNVVRDSDVDIAAELTEYAANTFVRGAEGLTVSDLGRTPYTGGYSLTAFKDDVQAALVAHFGPDAVDRGNKAIHIRESRRSLKADVVPCVRHRQNYARHRTAHNLGIKLLNDADPYEHIVNYPKQHLDVGVRKNDATQRRYKKVVRILKRLENEMVDEGLIAEVPSFLIESAVFNVPNSAFTTPSTWTGRVRNALAHLFNGTLDDSCYRSDEWLEANGIKYLFHSAQAWTYQDAHCFASRAWDYIGFD